ncbi:hypothetical protein PIROE2DRAFT_9380 [Piromyces sp. E2]|nr:hypothetical protein PIROE2DRAFT_9380 [Piromyces sp. E2]|eukprot:OUM63993.1 hypothetical protein PIROE2DRAFT_9380 [Piromyces sp. E2]
MITANIIEETKNITKLKDEKRNEIKELIKHNHNFGVFEKYITEKCIILKDLNKEDFDVLLYSIENDASPEIIKYIVCQCKYNDLNYHIIEDKTLKAPLFSSIGKNNFEISKLLIQKNADINYFNNDIINYLYNQGLLNKKNLRFILNNEFNWKAITTDLLNNLVEKEENDFLEIIFKHYIYNKSFILDLLKIYSQKTSLSNEQLNDILSKERNKFHITIEMYDKANEDTILNYNIQKLLFEHDNDDSYLVIRKINEYDLLKKAVILNDYQFVKEILQYKKFNCTDYNFYSIMNECKSNGNVYKLLIQSLLDMIPVIQDDSSKRMYDPKYFNLLLNKIIRVSMNNKNFFYYLIESNKYKSHMDLNEKDLNDEYPIFVAFRYGGTEIFEYLLKYNIDLNVKDNNNNTLLSLAVASGSKKILNHLLKHQVNINVKDNNGIYPLMKAIMKNDFDMVVLLTEHGKKHNINMNIHDINGNTPLTLSYKLNYKNIFKYLLNYYDINEKDSNGNNILYYVIENKDIIIMNYLIHNNIDITSKNKYMISCLDLAIIKGYEVLFPLLKCQFISSWSVNIQNSNDEIPLVSILKGSKYSLKEKSYIVEKLISKGSNVNSSDKDGNTSLIYAIQNKSLSIVKLLVENGANVNYYNPYTNKTILKYAVDSGVLDIVKYLVTYNASIYCNNPNAIPIFGKTIVDINEIYIDIVVYLIPKLRICDVNGNMVYKIIRNGKLYLLKNLITNNLDVNLKDYEGDSALANAIYYRNEDIVNYLIQCKGIDFHSKNNRGQSIADRNEEFFGKEDKYKAIYNKIKNCIETN